MEVNWIVKANQCLGLSLQSTKLPLPSTLVLRLSKWMICYIVAIQTIVWKHYQLNILISCFPMKLVWNRIPPQTEQGKDVFSPDTCTIMVASYPVFCFIITFIQKEMQNAGGNVKCFCLAPLTSVLLLEWWNASGKFQEAETALQLKPSHLFLMQNI